MSLTKFRAQLNNNGIRIAKHEDAQSNEKHWDFLWKKHEKNPRESGAQGEKEEQDFAFQPKWGFGLQLRLNLKADLFEFGRVLELKGRAGNLPRQ